MLRYTFGKLLYQEFAELRIRNQAIGNLTEERFNWQHYKNPAGESLFFQAWDGELLVGTEVLQLLNLTCKGKIIKSAIAVESFIDKHYRGQGIWKKLVQLSQQQAAAQRIDIIWGFPNKRSLPIVEKHLNWRYVGELVTVKKLVRAHAGDSIHKRLVHSFFGLVGREDSRKSDLHLKPWLLDSNIVFSKDFASGVRILKDSKYLQWRYIDCPDKCYRMSYLLDRREKTAGFIVLVTKNNTLFVMDYSVHERNADAFVHLIIKIARESSSAISLIVNTRNSILQTTRRAFFFRLGRAKLLANFINHNTQEYLEGQLWDMKMGDEDIHFCRAFK